MTAATSVCSLWLATYGLLGIAILAALALASHLIKTYISQYPLQHIAGPTAESFLNGNMPQLYDRKARQFIRESVKSFGGVVKLHGFLGEKELYVTDPRALHCILLKETHSFEETSAFLETVNMIFGPGMLAVCGTQHARQRKIANAIFTVGHLKALVPTFHECADRLATVMSVDSETSSSRIVNVGQWMSRFALEGIGMGMLSFSFDELTSATVNDYTIAINRLIPMLFDASLVRMFYPFIRSRGFMRFIMGWLPSPRIQAIRWVSDVMYRRGKEILRFHQSVTAAGGEEKNLVGCLLRANSAESPSNRMSEEELIGIMSVLIFAGQETTSSTLSRMLYMLARDAVVQEQLRQEVYTANKACGNTSGALDYDTLNSLPILDAVLTETLRIGAPVFHLKREASKTTLLPLSRPLMTSRGPVTSITVPKGTRMFLGIDAANTLESVWGEDALVWRPSRWLDPAAKPGIGEERLPSIYNGIFTFLAGSRACIGYRFAIAEMKVLIAVLIMRFKFSALDDNVIWDLSLTVNPKYVVEGEEEEKRGLRLVVTAVEDGTSSFEPTSYSPSTCVRSPS